MIDYEHLRQCTSEAETNSITLPALDEIPAFASPLELEPAPGANREVLPLILLAEDDAYTAETMSDYLLFHNFRVNLAYNGYEVIQQALSSNPRLIIMDIRMPGINGFEAMRRLRAEAATAKIPIIALTALAMTGDRERCLQAGANAYFSKPIRLRELMETIQAFLSLTG